MRAKLVKESISFKRGQSSKDTLELGFGSKIMNTKAFKVLEFIADSGEEGRSFTEIQRYIYFDINKAPKGEDWFDKKTQGRWNDKKGHWDDHVKGSRVSRGYWNAQLGSFLDRKGLLDYYCEKNEKGKWVLKRWPKRGEAIMGKPW